MDALDGRPRAEAISSVAELLRQALDARLTLVRGYGEGHNLSNVGAMIWLRRQGSRVPMLLGATDFHPHRPADTYHPSFDDFIAMANVLIEWCESKLATATSDSRDVPRAHHLAYLSLQYAEHACRKVLTGKEAYAYIKEHGFDVEHLDQFGQLVDYSIPGQDTWLTYLSRGRAAAGARKNSPRAGRSGRSIVDRREI